MEAIGMDFRVAIGGVTLDPVDLRMATDVVAAFVESGAPHQIVTVNLDFLAIARRDQQFRQVLNQADLALADGQPLVWIARYNGTPLPGRVAGIDLVHASCALAARRGFRPFLLGAAPGVAAAAARELQQLYPSLQIAGIYCPPFGSLSAEQDRTMVALIRAARPDLLFVALGAPRQDVWISQHLAELAVPVCMGVGGAFNFIAGVVPRAPRWMQRAGLEWSFRLCQEPGRLWRRYFVDDVPMLLRLLRRPEAGRLIPRLEPARPEAPGARLARSSSVATGKK